MTVNRKLNKTNLRGFRSETTERNERLKIWLTFFSGIVSALVGAFFVR
jgi:hypothetical protein